MSRILVNIDWCKGCSYCENACPKKVLVIGEDVNKFGYRFAIVSNELCNGCGLCYIVCPDYALTILAEEEQGN